MPPMRDTLCNPIVAGSAHFSSSARNRSIAVEATFGIYYFLPTWCTLDFIARMMEMSRHLFQSPKFAPPIEFVDQAALSPPEGYKDGGANLQQALGGALGGHIFGAQHIQQLQVIQRLQAQRAAMLAARSSGHNQNQSTTSPHSKASSTKPTATAEAAAAAANVCTECAECSECAAKQEHDEGKRSNSLTQHYESHENDSHSFRCRLAYSASAMTNRFSSTAKLQSRLVSFVPSSFFTCVIVRINIDQRRHGFLALMRFVAAT